MTMWNFIEIYWLEALQNWAWKSIFSRFFCFRCDFWDPWVLYLRTQDCVVNSHLQTILLYFREYAQRNNEKLSIKDI